MTNKQKLIEAQKINLAETSFARLMRKRIYKILIVCSNYDFFMLEEDGRIDEQLFAEYVSLNLRYPPAFIHADSAPRAIRILREEKIDLVIIMFSISSMDAFDFSKTIKNEIENVPVVVLTPFSREVNMKLQKENMSTIDHVFCWLGNADIMLAIIKLVEDKMNVEHDVSQVGVQTILLVEDGIQFYSSYLPVMYKIVLQQSIDFMREGLNDLREMIRLRGRPKILHAATFEDAVALYEKYKDNMLGVISDVAYKKNGVKDYDAGFELHKIVNQDDKTMPFLLQSAELKNQTIAKEQGIDFLYKHSKTLSIELSEYLFKNLAFGDFVFRMPDGREIDRAADLQTLQKKIENIPEESLRYHFNKNQFSRWFNARALFPVAQMFKHLVLDDFDSVDHARRYMLNVIAKFRRNKGRGVIAKFEKETYDNYLIFSRIGDGSLGGKGRGLAFIDSFLKRHSDCNRFENVLITIPRSVVISTDIFSTFMEQNNLYHIALSDVEDEQILEHFIKSHFPAEILNDLRVFLRFVENPVAIRSSSLLEDSHYQPFAGIYSTYMIPKTNDEDRMLQMLIDAIKCVYASVYYKTSKAYMQATSNRLDEEKMGIILQEVCGKSYNNLFYPQVSGVARSINFYPIAPEKPEDGIANIGFGLGRITVEGGQTIRFSPEYPKKVLQLSSPEMALRNSQKHFYALNLNPDEFKASVDDGINLRKIPIRKIQKDKSLRFVASTYDFQNHIIRDGIQYEGKNVITFANILKHNIFPLAEILQTLLSIGQKEMNSPIEIEFAINMDVPPGMPRIFNFLQIRPIVESNENADFNLDKTNPEDTIIFCEKALGNGIVKGISDLVYVKPEAFKSEKTRQIAQDVDKLNKQFLEDKKNYILIGPGRWGSSDPWLGIPVKWSQISAARLIVESGLKNYRIDPSQGTHFFQNLTSFRIGYFTMNPFMNDGFYNIDFLNQCKAKYEDEFLRHISFKNPLIIKIEGKNNRGVVFKPNATN